MSFIHEELYTSRIIKATALIEDTKILLQHWDFSLDTEENLDYIKTENLFAKSARSRVSDILRIFRRRYLNDENTVIALSRFVKDQVDRNTLTKILYFHSALADRLLYDAASQFLFEFLNRGRKEVTTDDFKLQIRTWNQANLMQSDWSEATIYSVAKNVAATLRDFGILEGAAKKRIATPQLPIGSLAYIAFLLNRQEISGNQLIHHPVWGIFLLKTENIERMFIEAHQQGFLEYYAAGSVVRIDFPVNTLEAYVNVIVQRTS